MKKTMVSLAAASLITTSAMAADKGIDIVTTGQAVIYYETHTSGGDNAPDIFSKEASAANVGVQLNLGSDLGNGITFGSQLSYLGTAGLEKNLVSGVKQDPTQSLNTDLTSQLMLTKIFVAKKIGNSTLKIGRQELPKSLSPLAFSEGWNVFKNTFDAILAVNSDIPDTTLVGAYVSKSNSTVGANGYANMTNLVGKTGLGNVYASGGAFLLTAQNKSIPMTTLTGSYYHLSQISGGDQDFWANSDSLGNADAYWIDAKVKGKDMPLGLCVGLQVGSIMPNLKTPLNDLDDTMAYGVKVGMKPMDALALSVAYSSVDDGAVAIKNTGTGVKTPLFTQMVYNQDAIALSADTFVVKGAFNTGDYGKIIAQFGLTNGNNDSDAKYNELDLIYKVKSGGIQYFAALMYITAEDGASIIGDGGSYAPGAKMDDTKLRIWARYAF
ncbi:MAG: hypothetical protein U9N33_00850 [Campylobacterota bacterium]|nr:hypothetical protein [Campylobacterota bacterium]